MHNHSYHTVVKNLKKAKRKLLNFKQDQLIEKGYPKWIVISQHEFLQNTVLDLEKTLKQIKNNNHKQKNYKKS